MWMSDEVGEWQLILSKSNSFKTIISKLTLSFIAEGTQYFSMPSIYKLGALWAIYSALSFLDKCNSH